MAAKTSVRASVILFWMLLSLPASDACRGGRGGGTSCRRPPTLVRGTCPWTMTVHAGPLSSSANVRWAEPRARTEDTHCGPVRVLREDGGPINGGYFDASQSPYYIRYSATDAKNNRQPNLCSFIVIVRIKRCGPHPPVTRGLVSCSHQDQYGSQCNITCSPGYFIQGSGTRTCQANATWSGLPPRCTV